MEFTNAKVLNLIGKCYQDHAISDFFNGLFLRVKMTLHATLVHVFLKSQVFSRQLLSFGITSPPQVAC